MRQRKKLTTKYGVEIPLDGAGRPLCDAPGKYDRSAAAMGSPKEHLPPVRGSAAKEAILCRDLVLATLQVNGSGQDSGEVDFRICCDAMQRVCTTHKQEVVKTLRQLIATVREHYGDPETVNTKDYL